MKGVMTPQATAHVQYEVDAEELVRLLAAPVQKDPRDITDPIALFGTAPLDPEPLPRAPLPSALTLTA
jgi:hypothetical protein